MKGEKRVFNAEFEDYYEKCLKELKGRANYTDAFLPALERYVTITAKLAELNVAIIDEEVVTQHTNKASHTNKATSPVWRMFLMLNREAMALAAELKLTPKSAPDKQKGDGKQKGFNLEVNRKAS